MQLPQSACDAALLAGGGTVVELPVLAVLGDMMDGAELVDPIEGGEPLNGVSDAGPIDSTELGEPDGPLAIDG